VWGVGTNSAVGVNKAAGAGVGGFGVGGQNVYTRTQHPTHASCRLSLRSGLMQRELPQQGDLSTAKPK